MNNQDQHIINGLNQSDLQLPPAVLLPGLAKSVKFSIVALRHLLGITPHYLLSLTDRGISNRFRMTKRCVSIKAEAAFIFCLQSCHGGST